MGALGYNLKKLTLEDSSLRAELLETNFASLDLDMIKMEIDAVRRKRPNLGNYVYHTSLNFSQEETGKLTNDKLLAIARDYLEGMGFTENHYMIFRHHDAGHPHIHLLANRIKFGGGLVSDSRNFEESEALLRKLELLHDLKPLTKSKFLAVQTTSNEVKVLRKGSTSKRAPTKDEIEMVTRTGKASHKMAVQEKLSLILNQPGRSMQDFIRHCEAQGVCLLFNQATTGHISGITFFYEDFKAKGQALGGRFKWMEIEKQLDYEQNRDGQSISEANDRTRTKYGELTSAGSGTNHDGGRRNDAATTFPDGKKLIECDQEHHANMGAAERDEATTGQDSNDDRQANNTPGTTSSAAVSDIPVAADWRSAGYGIEISDDIDDEAILGRNRRRQKQARTNRR